MIMQKQIKDENLKNAINNKYTLKFRDFLVFIVGEKLKDRRQNSRKCMIFYRCEETILKSQFNSEKKTIV